MSKLGDATNAYAEAVKCLDRLLALKPDDISVGLSAFSTKKDKVDSLVLERLREFFPQAVQKVEKELREEVARARQEVIAAEKMMATGPTLVKE